MPQDKKPAILVLGKLPEVAQRFADSCTVLATNRNTLTDTLHEQGPQVRLLATRGGVTIDDAAAGNHCRLWRGL